MEPDKCTSTGSNIWYTNGSSGSGDCAMSVLQLLHTGTEPTIDNRNGIGTGFLMAAQGRSAQRDGARKA